MCPYHRPVTDNHAGAKNSVRVDCHPLAQAHIRGQGGPLVYLARRWSRGIKNLDKVRESRIGIGHLDDGFAYVLPRDSQNSSRTAGIQLFDVLPVGQKSYIFRASLAETRHSGNLQVRVSAEGPAYQLRHLIQAFPHTQHLLPLTPMVVVQPLDELIGQIDLFRPVENEVVVHIHDERVA